MPKHILHLVNASHYGLLNLLDEATSRYHHGEGFHLCKGYGEKYKTKKAMISSNNTTNSQIN